MWVNSLREEEEVEEEQADEESAMSASFLLQVPKSD